MRCGKTGLAKKPGNNKLFKSYLIIYLRSKEYMHNFGVQNPATSMHNNQVAQEVIKGLLLSI